MMKHSSLAHTSTVSLLIVLLGGVFVALAGCASDETSSDQDIQGDTTTEQATTSPIASGRATYETYCASCHGPDGKGDGPVAADLSTQPADLTLLTANHGGSFPVDTLYQIIDGRKMVDAHGTRDMPVWGNIWSEEVDGEPVREDVVERRINELIEYLRSIQGEAEV